MPKYVNIPTYIEDNNYRYKMQKLESKIESQGNGIKTNIVNLEEIAKDLQTNPEYILKYFGIENGSQTNMKKAGKSNTNYIIQGDFSEAALVKMLDKFIEKFLLCPTCKLPELHLFANNERLSAKCDSCPFTGDIDNKHRLAAFILKNPPPSRSMAKTKK